MEELKDLIKQFGNNIEICIDKFIEGEFPNVKDKFSYRNKYKLAYIKTNEELHNIVKSFEELDSCGIFCIRYKDQTNIDVVQLLRYGMPSPMVKEMMLYDILGLDKRWCSNLGLTEEDEFIELRKQLLECDNFNFNKYSKETRDTIVKSVKDNSKFEPISDAKDYSIHSLSKECETFQKHKTPKRPPEIAEDLGIGDHEIFKDNNIDRGYKTTLSIYLFLIQI